MSMDHQSLAKINPIPYIGEIKKPGRPESAGETCSIVEAANYLDLPPLIERYGAWAICEDGIHCLYARYFIHKSRMGEDDWIEHVTEKPWVIASEFIAAFNRAKEIFGTAGENNK